MGLTLRKFTIDLQSLSLSFLLFFFLISEEKACLEKPLSKSVHAALFALPLHVPPEELNCKQASSHFSKIQRKPLSICIGNLKSERKKHGLQSLSP